ARRVLASLAFEPALADNRLVRAQFFGLALFTVAGCNSPDATLTPGTFTLKWASGEGADGLPKAFTEPVKVGVDAKGGMVIVGNGNSSMYLSKWSETGAPAFHAVFDLGTNQTATSMAIDGENIFVAGSYEGRPNFGSGPLELSIAT